MINSHNAFCAVAFFIRKGRKAVLDNLIISANSILPIFIIIILTNNITIHNFSKSMTV